MRCVRRWCGAGTPLAEAARVSTLRVGRRHPLALRRSRRRAPGARSAQLRGVRHVARARRDDLGGRCVRATARAPAVADRDGAPPSGARTHGGRRAAARTSPRQRPDRAGTTLRPCPTPSAGEPTNQDADDAGTRHHPVGRRRTGGSGYEAGGLSARARPRPAPAPRGPSGAPPARSRCRRRDRRRPARARAGLAARPDRRLDVRRRARRRARGRACCSWSRSPHAGRSDGGLMHDLLTAASGRTILLVTHRPEGLELVDDVVDLSRCCS